MVQDSPFFAAYSLKNSRKKSGFCYLPVLLVTSRTANSGVSVSQAFVKVLLRLTNTVMLTAHLRDCTNLNPELVELEPPDQAVSMDFHTDADSGNLLTLFTQSLPEEGGEQYLASLGEIFNDLADSDPSALNLLTRRW